MRAYDGPNSKLLYRWCSEVWNYFRHAIPGRAPPGLHVTDQGAQLLCTRHHSRIAVSELDPESAWTWAIPERADARSTGRLRPGLGIVFEALPKCDARNRHR